MHDGNRGVRWARPLGLLMALAMLAGACGGGEGLQAGAGGGDAGGETGNAGAASEGGAAEAGEELSGELSVAFRSNAEEAANEVVAAYRDVRPNVDVTLDIIPYESDEYRRELITRQLSDDLPDVLQILDRFATQLADAGITASLEDYLSSGPITQDSFAQPFFEQYVPTTGDNAGQPMGLPTNADAVVLYYNKDHFDEAGLDYPDDDWTWDDLVEASEELTIDDGNDLQYGFTTIYGWHAMYVPMIEAYGGSLLDDEGMANLTSDAAEQAFQSILGPVQDGSFVPPDVLAAQGDPSTAFANGIASMLAGVRGWLPGIRGGISDDFDVAQFPLVNGERVTGMGSRGIALTEAGVENGQLAYDFLDWFFDEEGGMAVQAATYGAVPPVESLYDSEIWRGLPAPPENNDPFVQALDVGIKNPVAIPANAQGKIDDAINTANEQVLLGGKSVAEALAEADQTIDEAISEAREE